MKRAIIRQTAIWALVAGSAAASAQGVNTPATVPGLRPAMPAASSPYQPPVPTTSSTPQQTPAPGPSLTPAQTPEPAPSQSPSETPREPVQAPPVQG